jgi:L-fuconolactonase
MAAPAPFIGNRIRTSKTLADWHAGAETEVAMEPELAIIDAHHHLYGDAADAHHYLLDELNADIDAGHRIVATVYVEAYHAGWRTEGPPELRSTGEIERIVRLTAAPESRPGDACRIASAIVSYVDLTSEARVASVLDAHLSTGQGRLRGVRQQSTWDGGRVGRFIANTPNPGLLNDRQFRNGYRRLREYGLSFEATVYHTQLAEVASLADGFPDIPIVLSHIGIPIGVEDYAQNRAQVFDRWRGGMRDLALRPNVNLKIGGLGMPVLGFGFEAGEKPANSSELAESWRSLILTCIETFGADRCLFESNFPIDRQSCSYVSLWNAYKIATRSLSQSERENVFGRTAVRVYRLPELGLWPMAPRP